MRLLKSRRTWVILVVILALWYPTAYPRGAAMAFFDVLRGHYEVQVYGLPLPWEGEYYRLLKEKYGVSLRPVADCVVPPSVKWYADGYNAVSCQQVLKKYGVDIFEECGNRAQSKWQQEWDAALRRAGVSKK
jgi:hypothetical protein